VDNADPGREIERLEAEDAERAATRERVASGGFSRYCWAIPSPANGAPQRLAGDPVSFVVAVTADADGAPEQAGGQLGWRSVTADLRTAQG
jgi:hypothetical protein